MSTGDPICKHGTWWHNCRRCNTDTGIPIGEDDKMLNQDMRERHVEESHHTCGFHKKNPGQQYAGCTCSGSYSLVLGPPPTPTPELSDSHPMTESGKLKEERVPEVAGRTVSTSLAELEHRLRHYILREQKEHRFDQDNGLIELLSECVRLSREYADHMNGGSHD